MYERSQCLLLLVTDIDVAEQISKKYGIGTVAITLRKSISASDNEWSALLYKDGSINEISLHFLGRQMRKKRSNWYGSDGIRWEISRFLP